LSGRTQVSARIEGAHAGAPLQKTVLLTSMGPIWYKGGGQGHSPLTTPPKTLRPQTQNKKARLCQVGLKARKLMGQRFSACAPAASCFPCRVGTAQPKNFRSKELGYLPFLIPVVRLRIIRVLVQEGWVCRGRGYRLRSLQATGIRSKLSGVGIDFTRS